MTPCDGQISRYYWASKHILVLKSFEMTLRETIVFGFKIPCPSGRAGSSPALGTIKKQGLAKIFRKSFSFSAASKLTSAQELYTNQPRKGSYSHGAGLSASLCSRTVPANQMGMYGRLSLPDEVAVARHILVDRCAWHWP